MLAQIRQAYSLRNNFRQLFHRPDDNYSVIDGLRAFSIISIFAFHCFRGVRYAVEWDSFVLLMQETPVWLRWVWNADKSVDIFFVISGFLIAGLLFREYQHHQKICLKSFYIRRFMRLSPVYLFAMLVYWKAGGGNSENLWANILYVNNFLPLEEQAMAWCWSLAVEEQFYILFPLFISTLFFNVRYRMAILALLFLLSFFINYVVLINDELIRNAPLADIYYEEKTFNHGFALLYDNLYTRYCSFIAGIAAAYLHFFYGNRLKSFFGNAFNNFLVTALSAAIIIQFMISPIFDPTLEVSNTYKNIYIITNRQVFGLALSALILAMLYPRGLSKWIAAIFSNKFWYPIAQLSYSMYIFHIMIAATIFVSIKANFDFYQVDYSYISLRWMGILLAIAFIFTILIALITYLLIEKPFMNLRRGYRAQLR